MNVPEILEAIKALPDEEMKDLVEGVKAILYKREKVCSTCGHIMDRRCWNCYESGPYDRVE